MTEQSNHSNKNAPCSQILYKNIPTELQGHCDNVHHSITCILQIYKSRQFYKINTYNSMKILVILISLEDDANKRQFVDDLDRLFPILFGHTNSWYLPSHQLRLADNHKQTLHLTDTIYLVVSWTWPVSSH